MESTIGTKFYSKINSIFTTFLTVENDRCKSSRFLIVTANLENGLVAAAFVNFGRPFEVLQGNAFQKDIKSGLEFINQGRLTISKEGDLWANHVGAI